MNLSNSRVLLFAVLIANRNGKQKIRIIEPLLRQTINSKLNRLVAAYLNKGAVEFK